MEQLSVFECSLDSADSVSLIDRLHCLEVIRGRYGANSVGMNGVYDPLDLFGLHGYNKQPAVAPNSSVEPWQRLGCRGVRARVPQKRISTT